METLRVVSTVAMVNNTGSSNTDGMGKFYYEYDSACSTPYVSAPSSPGRHGPGFYFSAPTSPMHPLVSCRADHNFMVTASAGIPKPEEDEASVSTGSDFEFSARFSELDGAFSMSTEPTMSSADELFCNGQIRPLKLSNHLQKPQVLGPLIDFEDEEEDENKAGSCSAVPEAVGERGRDRLCRDKSRHRRTRSLSPLRSSAQWVEEEHSKLEDEEGGDTDDKSKHIASSCSSSSNSTKRRGSKRWSLKDLLLYRSKSEGRGHTRERHWTLSFSSPAKQSSEKQKLTKQAEKPKPTGVKKPNASPNSNPNKGSSARRGVPISAHELHYTANRAQAEELRRKTFLPYRQGLFGCLGFPSKSYTTMNGFAKTLHPLSS